MPVTPERLRYLLERNAAKACTKEEIRELYAGVAGSGQEDLQHLLDEQFARIDPAVVVDDVDWEYMFGQIVKTHAPVRRMVWGRWVAAASIILILGLGGYFVFRHPAGRDQEVAKTTGAHDVAAPQASKAMITLADGRRVAIDSIQSGPLAMQGNARLVKTANGRIVYQGGRGAALATFSYNTLTNPRGSPVVDLTLSDGSHVWLNAGSSIRYPVSFAANERRVSMTGEAYFEITHRPDQPFFVEKGGVSVQVLGTHFNVNAYDDEPDLRVTLLEGSVRVRTTAPGRKADVVIQPGEQAADGVGGLTIHKSVDLDQVMAWKNGLFSFDNTDLRAVMRQVARWYDVQVIYDSAVTGESFMGGISRQTNVSALLKVLEATGKVHFKIEGRKVIVSK